MLTYLVYFLVWIFTLSAGILQSFIRAVLAVFRVSPASNRSSFRRWSHAVRQATTHARTGGEVTHVDLYTQSKLSRVGYHSGSRFCVFSIRYNCWVEPTWRVFLQLRACAYGRDHLKEEVGWHCTKRTYMFLGSSCLIGNKSRYIYCTYLNIISYLFNAICKKRLT